MSKNLFKIIGGKTYLFLHKIKNRLSHWYYQSEFTGNTDTLSLKGRIYCINPNRVRVGEKCCINDGVIMHAMGNIVLGNNVTISTDAKILTRSYDTSDWINECKSNKIEKNHVEQEIFLGDNTWIGASAIILPGVKISGRGVIVAAGSILSKSIDEDYVLVAGSPAKVIKRYSKLENEKLRCSQ